MSNPFVRDQQWRKFADELFCSTTKGNAVGQFTKGGNSPKNIVNVPGDMCPDHHRWRGGADVLLEWSDDDHRIVTMLLVRRLPKIVE